MGRIKIGVLVTLLALGGCDTRELPNREELVPKLSTPSSAIARVGATLFTAVNCPNDSLYPRCKVLIKPTVNEATGDCTVEAPNIYLEGDSAEYVIAFVLVKDAAGTEDPRFGFCPVLRDGVWLPQEKSLLDGKFDENWSSDAAGTGAKDLPRFAGCQKRARVKVKNSTTPKEYDYKLQFHYKLASGKTGVCIADPFIKNG